MQSADSISIKGCLVESVSKTCIKVRSVERLYVAENSMRCAGGSEALVIEKCKTTRSHNNQINN